MNDTSAKSASSLAVVEKKPHRPGGCVGIFFQLFDWNRRFAKKKLFSRKLLPPARAKQASKKFGGDEKLPKFRLIADENSGGFPSMKKNGTRDVSNELEVEMQAPGLVARLMGLDTLPSAQQHKTKKASFSKPVAVGDDIREKFVNTQSEFSMEDPNLEKGGVKNDLRPQKLQKIGAFEKLSATRFGAEALQFRSVMSRCRKHHPKLASPVKSPRIPPGRNSSRLIDAATKILEPGLQARNRAKYALTYANTKHCNTEENIMNERTILLSPDPWKNSDDYADGAKSLKCQSSCKKCGNLVNVKDTRLNLEEHASITNSLLPNYDTPSDLVEKSRLRPMISSIEQGERLSHRSQDQSTHIGSQVREKIQFHPEVPQNRKPFNQEGRIQWNLSSQDCKPQRNDSSSARLKAKSRLQNPMPVVRGRVPSSSRLANLQTNRVSSAANAVNETKNFVALNRSTSGRTRTRVPTNLGDSKFETERKSCSRRDDSLSPVRKRRSTSTGRHGESSASVSPTVWKHRNVKGDTMNVQRMGHESDSLNGTCIGSRLARPERSKRTDGNMDNKVAPFTFNSLMKQKSGMLKKMMEQHRNQYGIDYNSTRQVKTAIENEAKTCIENSLPLSGDALGALLEQKLKELTWQEEDELASECNPPKGTTAMILQELISALTAESPLSEDPVGVGSSRSGISCRNGSNGHLMSAKSPFQEERKVPEASVAYSRDIEHLSPGSVLEASFSNDSCISSSLDDHSGNGYINSMECSYEESQQWEPDTDLLDSATSWRRGATGKESVTDLVNLISRACRTNFFDTEICENKLCHAKEVILYSELLFKNAAPKDFSICSLLLDGLETLASTLWSNDSCFFGFEDNSKDSYQRRGFLFDCVIEYLDSSYGRCHKSGFREFTKVPSCMNAEMLIHEVVEEVRRWTYLVGSTPDELIDRDMSRSLGKWTDFEIETYETCVDIDEDILQALVDEIIIDYWDC